MGSISQPVLLSMAFLSYWLLVGAQRDWPCLQKASPWVPAASDSGFILSRCGTWMLNKDLVQPGASSGGWSPHSHSLSSPGPGDSSSITSGTRVTFFHVMLYEAKLMTLQLCSVTFLSSQPRSCCLLPCTGCLGCVWCFLGGRPSCVLNVHHVLCVAEKACHMAPVLHAMRAGKWLSHPGWVGWMDLWQMEFFALFRMLCKIPGT